jgi:hypothetical protein
MCRDRFRLRRDLRPASARARLPGRDLLLRRAGDHGSGRGPGGSAPDAIWIGRWDGARTLTDPAQPDPLWSSHRRIKQYTNGHKETHGGAGLVVDKDVIDDPVARVG